MNPSIKNTDIRLGNIIRVIENTNKKCFLPMRDKGRDNNGLICILSGSTTYQFSNETSASQQCFTVNAGDILFLPQKSRYSMTVHSEYHYIFVDFEILGDICPEADFFTLPEHFRYKQDFQSMLTKWSFEERYLRTECYMLLYKILSKIHKNASALYIPEYKKRRLHNAVEHMIDHYSSKITVSELANQCGMSEGHFRRLFDEVYKISPVQYLSHVRLKKAAELLQFGNQNITSIAFSCGFTNLYYFSRAFRNKMGMTPSEYRKIFQSIE